MLSEHSELGKYLEVTQKSGCRPVQQRMHAHTVLIRQRSRTVQQRMWRRAVPEATPPPGLRLPGCILLCQHWRFLLQDDVRIGALQHKQCSVTQACRDDAQAQHVRVRRLLNSKKRRWITWNAKELTPICASPQVIPGASCFGRLAAQWPASRMPATCGFSARRCVSAGLRPCCSRATACSMPRTPAPASAWPSADFAAV